MRLPGMAMSGMPNMPVRPDSMRPNLNVPPMGAMRVRPNMEKARQSHPKDPHNPDRQENCVNVHLLLSIITGILQLVMHDSAPRGFEGKTDRSFEHEPLPCNSFAGRSVRNEPGGGASESPHILRYGRRLRRTPPLQLLCGGGR